MTEIHGSQPEGVIGFADGKFTFIEFDLDFEYVVTRLQAVTVCTFYIVQKFCEDGLVFFCHFFHLLCFYHRGVGIICFHDDLGGRQCFIDLCHFVSQYRHPVGCLNLSAHIEWLLQLYAAQKHRSDFIVKVYTREEGELLELSRGREDGELSASGTVSTVGGAIQAGGVGS